MLCHFCRCQQNAATETSVTYLVSLLRKGTEAGRRACLTCQPASYRSRSFKTIYIICAFSLCSSPPCGSLTLRPCSQHALLFPAFKLTAANAGLPSGGKPLRCQPQ